MAAAYYSPRSRTLTGRRPRRRSRRRSGSAARCRPRCSPAVHTTTVHVGNAVITPTTNATIATPSAVYPMRFPVSASLAYRAAPFRDRVVYHDAQPRCAKVSSIAAGDAARGRTRCGPGAGWPRGYRARVPLGGSARNFTSLVGPLRRERAHARPPRSRRAPGTGTPRARTDWTAIASINRIPETLPRRRERDHIARRVPVDDGARAPDRERARARVRAGARAWRP